MLAIVACVFQIVGYGLYYRAILKKNLHPSVISWGIWALVAVLNFTSYQEMSQDWVKSALPTVSSLLCLLTFVLALVRGEWKRVGMFDVIALCLCIVAGIGWWQSKSAMYGNIILQAGIIIGFIPTMKSVWQDPRSEKSPLPWFVWTGAYLLDCVVVVLRWKQPSDLIYPGGCLIASALVGFLTLRHRS